MEKTYILTESELQALLREQREICSEKAEVRSTDSGTIINIRKSSIVNAPTPDLSHLKEAEQK
jgi:hypothetical protein